MTPDQRQNPKLLWGIATGLVLVVAAALAVSQWLSQETEQTNTQTEMLNSTVVSAPKAEANIESSSSSEPITTDLVQDSILKDPVTENAVLAEEEIAKLNDIQVQLTEQEQVLKAQHADADELLKLKEEQIKLIEAQLGAQ